MAAKIFRVAGPWKGRLGIVPRPRGAEWLDDEIRSWRQAGIDAVVSLLEPAETVELDLTGEPSLSAASGLAFRSFPIPDRHVPRSHEAVAELTSHIVGTLRMGKTVVVHCRQSVGRSAMIVAATLITAGLDAETAVETIRYARGCDVPETKDQRQWISDFSAWSSTKRSKCRSSVASA